ncbi:uncharacterized protein L203_100119 [Cryptococcus depauperatus CBS 7841]|uniref:Uncharacterized protein n=1 Tax=Cryptococcus depauperatus CBS 7841 TaxID=1295531 RepID=A0A1E3IZI9_9TREE|nr:hypothetical protein L203_00217 [Cryptococcus depauperatus CBS 7841]
MSSSSSNPSHLLISRNSPRSPAHPQLDPTLTSRHGPFIFSPSSTPRLGRWFSDEIRRSSQDMMDVTEEEEEEGPIEVHPTFMEGADLPGRIKVVVGKNEFWCHKDVLWFASPFFEGLLQGSWAESNKENGKDGRTTVKTSQVFVDMDQAICHFEPDIGDVVDDQASRPTSLGEARRLESDKSEDIKDQVSVYLDPTGDEGVDSNILKFETAQKETYQDQKTPLETTHSFTNLSPLIPHINTQDSLRPAQIKKRNRSLLRASFSSSLHPTQDGIKSKNAEVVVELHDESASAFQDFLYWTYPHLECKVSWTNVAPLYSLSTKLLVTGLQKMCSHFLLTHASGHPVTALSLAEQYDNAELYREASRFVLDQAVWDNAEIKELTVRTQLKLSNKRSWFLERMLKLSAIDVKKEYSCRPDCPDPSRCQTQLDEKWRQAHSAVSRYGPPQPSVAFRCLRQLETFPTNPSLSMPHTSCQTTAKAWCMSLFDRMFQLNKLVTPANPGTEKYWLWITMKEPLM